MSGSSLSALGLVLPEIEVTSEMADAGGRMIDHYDRDFDDPAKLARDVFETMLAVRAKGL